MKIHFVNYEFGNRIRLCDRMMNKDCDDTTDYTYKVTCERCLKMLKENNEDD